MIHMGYPGDPILVAIGKIAIRHGQLDYSLKMTVRALAGISITEAVDATHRQSSSALRDRVHKLARKRFGESVTLVRLDALLMRARRATDKRNELLHALWAHELDGDPVMRSEGMAFRPIPTVQELEEVAGEMARITDQIMEARIHGFLRGTARRAHCPCGRKLTRSLVELDPG
jgi:hypothetical protein